MVDDVCLIEEMGDIQEFFWVKWVSKVFLSICLFIEWQNDPGVNKRSHFLENKQSAFQNYAVFTTGMGFVGWSDDFLNGIQGKCSAPFYHPHPPF